MSRFYKSIDKVNIGAFPLRPRDEENRMLLEHFIEGLIKNKSQEVIARVIPQKGTFVEVGNRVLIGYVVEGRAGYSDYFENGTATLYYTGRQIPTTIALQDLHFFIPYIKGKGIRDVYEIIRILERNKKRDVEEERQLAAMGWHCITIWECQLKPKVCAQTLESLAFTLNHIFLEDRKIKTYTTSEDEDTPMAAEPEMEYTND